MANDRLFLRCNVCKDATFLAKWTGNGFYRNMISKEPWTQLHSEQKIGTAFIEFADAHQYCGEGSGMMRGGDALELVHEAELDLTEYNDKTK